MPGTKYQGAPRGTRVSTAGHSFVITLAEVNQITTASGKVAAIIVWGTDAGTSCVVDVYDNASANTGQIWKWVTADGKNPYALQIPIQNGLRVVTTGTMPTNGGITVVFD